MLFFTINIILKKKKQIESKTSIDKKNCIFDIFQQIKILLKYVINFFLFLISCLLCHY